MNGGPQRLSVPPTRTLPRPLTARERATLLKVADMLCPGRDAVADPSAHPEFLPMLEVALAARSDAFVVIVTLLEAAAEQTALDSWLREVHAGDSEGFQALSAVVAGAYLLVPVVRAAIGYPGQGRSIPRVDEAFDQISDGILDPVLARGHFYVPTPAVGPVT